LLMHYQIPISIPPQKTIRPKTTPDNPAPQAQKKRKKEKKMGVLLSTIRGALNLLLPFTNPQTPLLQDLIHTTILCGTLYYAPQIAEHYNAHYAPAGREERARIPTPPNNDNTAEEVNQEEEDEHIVQHDDAEERLGPRPHAPTPPPDDQGPDGAHPAPADNDDGQWQQNLPNEEAGPANPRPAPTNRTIGAKKAKSIARRDQRRAYHEFHRSQAEERRLMEEQGRSEREAALTLEKQRRAEEERKIGEKQRVEREKRKDDERREQDDERERRERTVSRVRAEVEEKGAVDLVGVAWEEGKDRVWVERLVKASGMVGQMEKERVGSRVLITDEGWMVRVDAELMERAYADAVAYGDRDGNGRISFSEFGNILEKAVMARADAVAV
jgi:hypothetical protein